MDMLEFGKNFLYDERYGFIDYQEGKVVEKDSYVDFLSEDKSIHGRVYNNGFGFLKKDNKIIGLCFQDGSAYYRDLDGNCGFKYGDHSGVFYGINGCKVIRIDELNGYSIDEDGTLLTKGNFDLSLVSDYHMLLEKKDYDTIEKIEIDENLQIYIKSLHKTVNRIGKLIKFNLESRKLVGNSLKLVKNNLKAQGFTNMIPFPINDIYLESKYYYESVSRIIIRGDFEFDVNTTLPYDVPIYLEYHNKRKIHFPFTKEDVLNMDYRVLVHRLINEGYTNIYLHTKKNGFFFTKPENTVAYIIFEGKEDVEIAERLDYDIKMDIYYYV